MLTLDQTGIYAHTAQFTGADLKKWYAESGWTRIYICHVLEKVVEAALGQVLTAKSADVIDALRAAVPNRFKKNVRTTVVDNQLLKKYVSRERFSAAYHTRVNLLNCVPDDHVFTILFN